MDAEVADSAARMQRRRRSAAVCDESQGEFNRSPGASARITRFHPLLVPPEAAWCLPYNVKPIAVIC
ncbi:MAG TPA: hypothetical protein GXX19_08650 [Syntrophomonadaceae bacterium]|nr:hypothetical protein [Syntrophomonadaceae bacterium]